MTGMTYTRYELLRLVRNRRFFLFSLGFPLLLYFLIATPNRHEHDLGGSGISAPLYLMVGLVAFGTMNGVMSAGARIAAERVLGWNRQLRLTPLPTRVYFRTKIRYEPASRSASSTSSRRSAISFTRRSRPPDSSSSGSGWRRSSRSTGR